MQPIRFGKVFTMFSDYPYADARAFAAHLRKNGTEAQVGKGEKSHFIYTNSSEDNNALKLLQNIGEIEQVFDSLEIDTKLNPEEKTARAKSLDNLLHTTLQRLSSLEDWSEHITRDEEGRINGIHYLSL